MIRQVYYCLLNSLILRIRGEGEGGGSITKREMPPFRTETRSGLYF
jgi:hypothetical protein